MARLVEKYNTSSGWRQMYGGGGGRPPESSTLSPLLFMSRNVNRITVYNISEWASYVKQILVEASVISGGNNLA